MGRSRDDGQLMRASELFRCPTIEVEHDMIVTTDDQERRCPYGGQVGSCKIGSSTP